MIRCFLEYFQAKWIPVRAKEMRPNKKLESVRASVKIRTALVVAFVVLANTAPASADFGDCMDGDYLGGFGGPDAETDPFSPVRMITCIVEFDIEYASPAGRRHIRGIRDASADWGFRPGALAQIEVGARAAINAMSQLGAFQVEDITILILDDSYDLLSIPPGSDGSVAAVTNGNIAGDECYITSFMFGPTGRAAEIPQTTAHEIFHCIQAASLSAAQWTTTDAGGAWWAEGSAEYFAALAVPDVGDMHHRAAAFDRAVAAETPLYDDTYGMAVFFHWLHHRSGAAGLMPFLNQMAGSSGDRAQRSAMRNVLSDDGWLEFAEAYADRSISMPNGAALAFSGDDGENIYFDENRTERTSLRPFILRRGWITYDCGRWENEQTPDNANLGVRAESDSAWASLPPEIDASSGVEMRYRFAALHTGDSDQRVSIKVERVHGCQPCADSDELDACVVGTWVMSGGGAIEWMKSQGIPIVRDNPGTRVIRYDDHGVYYTREFATQITVEMRGETAYGQGVAVPAAGRWSIAEGQLAVCQDSGGMSGTVTKGSVTLPISAPGRGTIKMDYSCSATTLDTSLDVGSGPPMRTTYSKITVPTEP